MALISKIRQRTGLAVGIVAFGLILFLVGGDLLRPNSTLLGGNPSQVGEIAGENISIQEYQQIIEEVKYNYSLNTGSNPSESQMTSIRQQAWDKLIAQNAFKEQYQKLGVQVTEEEVVDMVQGNNIRPEIRRAFTNPQTGEFSRERIVQYLQNLNRMPQQQQAAWYSFESNLKPSRLRLKYENLLLKSNYVTEPEARQVYESENKVAEVEYLNIPYYSVPDSQVSVSESQLRNYLNNHKKEYQVEASRSMKYVTIPIIPSPQDTAYFMEEMAEIKEEFKNATNDSAYASLNSEGTQVYQSYKAGQLPTRLQENVASLEEGEILGPYAEENGMYTLYKVSEIEQDSVFSARASHILFKVDEGENESEVRRQARDVLQQLQEGANFTAMARQYSEDPSSNRGGDLGWFKEGRMVPEFEEAVFSRNSAGLINRIVETEYGYHIIRVTEPKTKKNYVITSVSRELFAGDETRNEAFRKADLFRGNIGDLESFNQQAEDEGLNVRTASNIGKNDRNIANLSESRNIVQWTYNEASVGDVSQVFEVEDAFLIGVLTDKTQEGTAKLDDVRAEIETKVKNQQKADIIIEKLNEISGNTLQEKATAYGTDAEVYSTSNLTLNSNTLPNVGVAPKAVGIAFAQNSGETSAPIKGENSVIVIKTEAIIDAPEIADYSASKNQLRQTQNSRVSFKISEAIKEFANIEDQRYKFY